LRDNSFTLSAFYVRIAKKLTQLEKPLYIAEQLACWRFLERRRQAPLALCAPAAAYVAAGNGYACGSS
jgi:hypothetical protein